MTLPKTKSVYTTCPYCGVGCGVVATVQPEEDNRVVVTVAGDKNHPANFGRLCSKGSALGETVSTDSRMLFPEVRGQRVTWTDALSEVASGFSQVIAKHGPDSVAFYVSGQLLTEDYYVANKLMKGYIGSANIDTNSRLCMSSAVAAYKRAFGSDTVPCSYEDLERAKVIVLVGSNTAWCHPVLYQRIVKAKETHPDLTLVVIDPQRTATCEIADLHLPLKPQTDAILFNGLLAYLDQHGEIDQDYVNDHTEGATDALASAHASASNIAKVAGQCGLTEEDAAEFYRLFARTERVVTVFSQGVNQSSSGTDKINAIINCHLLTGRIGRAGMGPFSFTGQPNAMGGREVGGLANQLAAHMHIENPADRDRVQRFWQSPVIAQKAGLNAVDLFEAVGTGKIKALWIMATNPAVSLPDNQRVRDAIAGCEFVVVSDCERDTDTTALAHVLLPAQAWGEKDGTVTNSERRISRQRAFISAPGEAKPDWWIICEVAKRMGFDAGFNYTTPADIFSEHAKLTAFENQGTRDLNIEGLANLSAENYETFTPVQWPVTVTKPQGTARMFSDGQFFTHNGKARFVPITPRPPSHATDSSFPLVLNTGRVRDQWHTMTRTGKSPRLTEHHAEPFASIHPRDAAAAGITDNTLVKVFSRWGEVIVRAAVSDQQQPGSVFVPIHWNDQFASHGVVGSAVNAAVDPVSGQPEFKHTPVRIASYTPAWHGFLLCRRKLADLTPATYWARATGNGFYRYELAGEEPPLHWPAWSRSLLCTSDKDVNWVEYLDKSARIYRGVRIIANRVESCMFIGPTHSLPPRTWLAGLFAKNTVSDRERMSLLTGQPPRGEVDGGPVVCACFSVGLNTLKRAITNDALTSVDAIGKALQAGTNCGSCIPELKRLIGQSVPGTKP